MGSDLTLNGMAYRTGKPPSLEKAKAFIDSLTIDDLKKVGEDPDEIMDDWEFEHVDFENPTEKDLSEVRDMLLSWITELIEAVDPKQYRRDITGWTICGWEVYVTGGMTSGDDPTELFTEIQRVDNWGSLALRVYEAAGFGWPPREPEQFVVNEEVTPADG